MKLFRRQPPKGIYYWAKNLDLGTSESGIEETQNIIMPREREGMPTAMQNAKKKKLTRATYMNRIVRKNSAEKEELGPRARDTQLLLQHDRHQNRKKKEKKK